MQAISPLNGVIADQSRQRDRMIRWSSISTAAAACMRHNAAALRAARACSPPGSWAASSSSGLAIAPDGDERLAPFRENGRRLFRERLGQLHFSCAQCHDGLWGERLGGSVIPQAHPTGYPIYRLEWQGVGSLQRRLRNCLTGVRAEPFAYGAQEYVDLELYLMDRARGLAVETPAVRP